MPVFGQQEAGESVADVEEPGNGLIFGGKDLLSFENLWYAHISDVPQLFTTKDTPRTGPYGREHKRSTNSIENPSGIFYRI